MFSHRTGWDRRPNDLTRLIEAKRAAGRPVLDLTASNPTRAGLAWSGDAVSAALRCEDNVLYEPHPQGLRVAREAVAAWYAARGVVADPDRIVLTASTSEAYSMLFKLLCDEGDAVMVMSPSYPLFEFLARLDSVRTVPYRLRLAEGVAGWWLDCEALAAGLPERARAVLAVNPNNPTGSMLAMGEAAALAALCRERGLALVSDEVFADFAWTAGDGTRPTSLLPVGQAGGALTFVMSGLSKGCGLPQLKLGWIVVGGPDALVAEALARLELVADTYLSVNTPVQNGLASLLAGGADFRRRVLSRLSTNRAALASRLPASSCRMLPAHAGWYATLELPSALEEDALVHSLLDEDDVLAHPGFFFDMPGGPHVVLSLLTAPETFAEGLARLLARVRS